MCIIFISLKTTPVIEVFKKSEDKENDIYIGFSFGDRVSPYISNVCYLGHYT